MKECKFELRSYSHTQEEMFFQMYNKFDDLTAYAATVLDYRVRLTPIPDCKIQKGTWIQTRHSCVGFTMNMKRYASKYFINHYLPSIVFVIVSWVSFIIPIDIVPGRMALLITILLVLINQFGTVVNTQPPNITPTAITIWFITCIGFVAGALVAYACLLYQKARFKRMLRKSKKTHMGFSGKLRVNNPTQTMEQLDNGLADWDFKFLIGFPITFVICNFIYWPFVLSSK